MRIFQREVGVGAADFRTLVESGNEAVGVVEQLGDGAAVLVLNVQFEAIDASETRQHVLRVHLNLGIGDVGGTAVDLVDYALHIVAFALAITPLLELQREVAVRR